MIGFELNDAVIVEQKQVLEQALSTNPKTQKTLQGLIRRVIRESSKEVVKSASAAIKADPRGAARAVRTTVYKKILGANINIYNSRKAHGSTSYEPPRTLRAGQRGGNRRQRSERTKSIMGYEALDRGFILRWINDGTPGNRNIRFIPNEKRKVDRWNHNPNTGRRGNVEARHFFVSAGESALVKAADALANLIDTELDNILNKKK